MNRFTVTTISFISFLIACQSLNAQDYQPPIGIPAPEFGINEQLSDYYTRPDPWDTEVAGWYYID